MESAVTIVSGLVAIAAAVIAALRWLWRKRKSAASAEPASMVGEMDRAASTVKQAASALDQLAALRGSRPIGREQERARLAWVDVIGLRDHLAVVLGARHPLPELIGAVPSLLLLPIGVAHCDFGPDEPQVDTAYAEIAGFAQVFEHHFRACASRVAQGKRLRPSDLRIEAPHNVGGAASWITTTAMKRDPARAVGNPKPWHPDVTGSTSEPG